MSDPVLRLPKGKQPLRLHLQKKHGLTYPSKQGPKLAAMEADHLSFHDGTWADVVPGGWHRHDWPDGEWK